MKRALVVLMVLVVAIAIVLWVATWFRNPGAVATSAAQPWPGGMGTLDSVAGRITPVQANEASVELAALVNALPASEAVGEFVGREIVKDDLTIGEPPELPDLSAIRELLLRKPIVWGRDGGIGEVGDQETSERRGVQMRVARWLIASALAEARANDSAAWESLEAVWNLARSMEGQPHVMEQTAALSMARMINAVAWKMPLPAPAWPGQLRERDHVRPLLEAFQVQTASYWEDSRLFPTKWHADWVEHDRRIAEALLGETRCDVSAAENKHGTDLRSVWRRVFRFRAEREATANALRIRQGEPIEEKSVCSEGAWTFDGTTLRFSPEIAPPVPDTAMPLALQLEP